MVRINDMVRIIVVMALFAALLASPSAAGAEEDWKEEFKRLCSYTDISNTLSDEELETLVKDSDILFEKLEALDAPEAKVYIFRLKKCRNMYRFIIDTRAAKKKG